MDFDPIDTRLSDRERADLAALADDSLPPRRRKAIEARLEARPAVKRAEVFG